MHTPGHTPADMTYVIGDAAFVGDTLFMPDAGTARADFPGGDAHKLFQSTRRILHELPDETRLFMCHDYKAPGRDTYAWETTVTGSEDGTARVWDAATGDGLAVLEGHAGWVRAAAFSPDGRRIGHGVR